MNLFKIYFRRNSIICCTLAFLLVLAISFGALGYYSLITTGQRLREVGSQYTTIAVPSDANVWFTFMQQNESEERTAMMAADGFGQIDQRAMLGAHIAGTQRFTTYEANQLLNNAANCYNSNLFIVAAQCDSVSPSENEGMITYTDENGQMTQIETITCTYEASFTVLDTVIRTEIYEVYPVETVTIGGLYTSELEIPFEVGNTYLLFGSEYGFATDVDSETNQYIVHEELSGWKPMMYDHTNGAFFDEGLLIDVEEVEVDGKIYNCLTADAAPVFAQYEGAWEDFIASDEGALWRETWIPMCQTNYASANVILTNNIYSILSFNDGSATIMDGRCISKEEFESGANVCLVSSAYAQKNGLSLGDTLEMELYSCDSVVAHSWVQSGFSLGSENLFIFEPLKVENKLDIQKSYTIVGIYSAPEFPVSKYTFDANTIFVPKASVPNSQEFEEPGNNLLNSIVLENGMQEAFLDSMAKQGYEDAFEIYDMGFSSVAGPLLASRENAQRLFVIGLAVFILVSILYHVILLQRLKPSIRSMRQIGIKPKMIRRQLMVLLLTSVVAALCIGTMLSAGLFGYISNLLLSERMTANLVEVIMCAAVQLVFLLILGYMLASAAAKRNLMQK